MPELRRITGGRTLAEQVEWLREEGIPFKIDHKGRLQVASEHVTGWIRGEQVRAPASPRMDLVR
jgi:hypothetical protein